MNFSKKFLKTASHFDPINENGGYMIVLYFPRKYWWGYRRMKFWYSSHQRIAFLEDIQKLREFFEGN